jgi:hypothetical protein
MFEPAGKAGTLLAGIDEVESKDLFDVPMTESKAVAIVAPVFDQLRSFQDPEGSELVLGGDRLNLGLVPQDPDESKGDEDEG